MWRRTLLEQLDLIILVGSDGLIQSLPKNNIKCKEIALVGLFARKEI